MMLSEIAPMLDNPLIAAAALGFAILFAHFLAAEVDDGF
jgi:hypothetical protein